jgi:hypothetical protein
MTYVNKRATSANWPHNTTFWDKVIVPPALTMKEKEENQKKYECKTWYLCTEENPNK